MRGCRRSGVAVILVTRVHGVRCRFVVISVREIRCGRVHGDEIIGVDVLSQRVYDVVKGSRVLFVDVPRDSVKVVEGTRGGRCLAALASRVGAVSFGLRSFLETVSFA